MASQKDNGNPTPGTQTLFVSPWNYLPEVTQGLRSPSASGSMTCASGRRAAGRGGVHPKERSSCDHAGRAGVHRIEAGMRPSRNTTPRPSGIS